jgi:hypothetical protein
MFVQHLLLRVEAEWIRCCRSLWLLLHCCVGGAERRVGVVVVVVLEDQEKGDDLRKDTDVGMELAAFAARAALRRDQSHLSRRAAAGKVKALLFCRGCYCAYLYN